MHVGMVGINHKQAKLQLRELLASVCERLFGVGAVRKSSDPTYLLLSTCNRTEIYFSSDNLAEAHTHVLAQLRRHIDEPFDQKLYAYFGHDCFSHLAEVTAGLDSAIPGETEIQGQVKRTYEMVARLYTLPKDIHYLFQKSLSVGKKVRSSVDLTRAATSMESLLHQLAIERSAKKILFVGASDINGSIVRRFATVPEFQLTLCNRSQERGKKFANHHQMTFLPWEEFSQWTEFDLIVLGTKSSRYLITLSDLVGLKKEPLIIDLCVPRNADPRIAAHHSVDLINIDEIDAIIAARSQHGHRLIDQARTILERSVDRLIQRTCAKAESRPPTVPPHSGSLDISASCA